MMQDYCIKIKPLAPIGTPWQSDTIFGHLCWQVVFGAIDMDIETFLESFRDGHPPFVLSEAFPAGYLPRPMIYAPSPRVDTPEEYDRQKKKKKARYITKADFVHRCRGESPLDTFLPDPWRMVIRPHASPDRNSFSTDHEGGFFETEAIQLEHQDGLEIYIRTEPNWKERVLTLFQALEQVGFGRDKSTGLGAFRLGEMIPVEIFQAVDDGCNGFVNLSSMVPAKDDPREGWFRLRTKYGKLGEGVFGNPFKRPLLQIEPGAVFYAGGEIRPYYGRLVRDIAPGDSRVVQNGYAMTAPCRISK